MGRRQSPAYLVLPQSCRRVLAEVERAIGTHECAKLSRGMLEARGVAKGTATVALRRLRALGFLDLERGARRVCIFKLSDRWSSIDEVEARRLLKATEPNRRGPGRRPQRAPGGSALAV
jgi:DNA-binding transcriptional regulator PaaX